MNQESPWRARLRILIPGLVAAALLASYVPTVAQDAARLDLGRKAWLSAGCSGCHGDQGQGGTSTEFPAGPSLRNTGLDRDGLVEVISCGLPGTKMPAWLKGAYTESPCFGEIGPVPAGTVVLGVLSAQEIEALVDYMMAEFVQVSPSAR